MIIKPMGPAEIYDLIHYVPTKADDIWMVESASRLSVLKQTVERFQTIDRTYQKGFISGEKAQVMNHALILELESEIAELEKEAK